MTTSTRAVYIGIVLLATTMQISHHGTQTGTTLTLAGSPSHSLLLSANGTRALITTFVTDPITGYTTSTRVAVLQIA
jgi:hypothetical protein